MLSWVRPLAMTRRVIFVTLYLVCTPLFRFLVMSHFLVIGMALTAFSMSLQVLIRWSCSSSSVCMTGFDFGQSREYFSSFRQ